MADFNLDLILTVFLIFSISNFVRGSSVSCTFDSDLCGWRSVGTGKFQWKRDSGLTEDRSSGPLNDHTCANYQGNYISVSGGDAESRKDIAILESPIFTLNNDTTFSFWYTMNGFGTGTLSLSAVVGKTSREVWRKAGRQGKDWIQDSVTLKSGMMKLQFKSTVRIPVGSDLAIDDIQLLSESQLKDTNKTHCQTTTTMTTTPTIPTTTTAERMNKTHKFSSLTTFSSSNPPSSSSSSSCLKFVGTSEIMSGTCDFEKDTCGIKITANNSNTGVTWERTSKIDGSKDRKDTISGDHTFEKDDTQGFYIVFRNAWSLWNSKLIASFETPAIYATYACLSFWYSVPTGYSNLKVSTRKYTGRLTQVWSVDNFIPKMKASNMTGWHEETLSLLEDPPFTVVFQAYNNMHSAVVGVDDIKIIGANVTTGRTKPVFGKTTQVNHTPDSTTRSTPVTSTQGLTTTSENHTQGSTSKATPGITSSSVSTEKLTTISVKPSGTTITSALITTTKTTTKTPASTRLDTTTLHIAGTTDKGGKKTTQHTTKKPTFTTSCPKPANTTKVMPGTCDFEIDTCGIKITANNSNTQVTWERTNKMDGTIYQSDSIFRDHTFERSTTKGFYLVFRNGAYRFGSNPKQTANIETPAIYATHACLSFWYTVPSVYSNLKVLIRGNTGRLIPVWNVDNNIPSKKASNMTGWHEKSLSITEEPPFTVVFQTYNNYQLAKVGIDDITISGVSVTTLKTTPVTDKATHMEHTPQTTPRLTSKTRSSTPTEMLTATSTSSNLQTTTRPVSDIPTQKTTPVTDNETHVKNTTQTTSRLSSKTGSSTPTEIPTAKITLSKLQNTTQPVSDSTTRKTTPVTDKSTHVKSTTQTASRLTSKTVSLPSTEMLTASSTLSKLQTTTQPASASTTIWKTTPVTDKATNVKNTTQTTSRLSSKTVSLPSTEMLTASSTLSNLQTTTQHVSDTTSWQTTPVTDNAIHAKNTTKTMSRLTSKTGSSAPTEMLTASSTLSKLQTTTQHVSDSTTRKKTPVTGNATYMKNTTQTTSKLTSKTGNSTSTEMFTATNNLSKLQTTTQPVSASTDKGGKKTPAHTTKKPTKIIFEIGDKGKQTEEEDKYQKTSTIVGSTVGAVLALVLLTVVMYFILHYKTKDKRRMRREEKKTENQHHLNGGLSNGGFTSGTNFNGSVSSEKRNSNGHRGNVYDNFTAYSLTPVNTFTPEHKQLNGDARMNGHASPIAENYTCSSVRL